MNSHCAIAFLWSAVLATALEPRAVQVQIRNLSFRLSSGGAMELRSARGELVPTRTGEPVTFDDPASFRLRLAAAEVAITSKNLASLMNDYVFAEKDSPLRNVSVQFEPPRMRLKGTMHKGVDLPFDIVGTLAPTAEGDIRFHADKVASAHVPLKGLLHLLGEDLSKLVNLREARGVRTASDDIFLYPNRMTPAPHIEGKVTAVRVTADRLWLTFGTPGAAKPLRPPRPARNYIYHQGGVLRFGKLTMTAVDLELVDQNAGDLFDFNLADYNRQLVAGYSKNTPSHGLIVFLPDYWRLPR